MISLIALCLALLTQSNAGTPQADAAEIISHMGPQQLAKSLCDSSQSLQSAKESAKSARELKQSGVMKDKAKMEQIVQAHERALETTEHFIADGKAAYRKRTDREFDEKICDQNAADIQLEACHLVRVQTEYTKILADLQKSKASQVDKQLQVSTRKSIDEFTAKITAKKIEFQKLTSSPADLKGCEKDFEQQSLEGKVARDNFKQGCFYLLQIGGIGHYFVGAIATSTDGAADFAAIGECYKKDCSDEESALQKHYTAKTLASITRRDYGPPLCSKKFETFYEALRQARLAVSPEDRLLPETRDALDFAMVPLTCGYSKPCLQASLRAWEQIKQKLVSTF